MNKKSLAQLVAVVVSLLLIWFINDLLIIDKCLENGGRFDYQTAKCLLANNEEFTFSYINYLLGSYFVIAIVVAMLVSKTIQKWLNAH